MPETLGQSRGKDILIVEDDTEFALTLERTLAREGYQCQRQENVDEAKEAVSAVAFDLVLADVRLPGGSGLEVASYVGEQCPGTPVIVITGSPSMDSAIKSINLSVAAYLVKPFETSELLEAIAEQIGARDRYLELERSERKLREQIAALRDLEEHAEEGEPGDRKADRLATLLDRSKALLQAVPSPPRTEWQSQRLARMDAALRETVRVLESTRRQFKSKELARLRRELERLLQGV